MISLAFSCNFRLSSFGYFLSQRTRRHTLSYSDAQTMDPSCLSRLHVCRLRPLHVVSNICGVVCREFYMSFRGPKIIAALCLCPLQVQLINLMHNEKRPNNRQRKQRCCNMWRVFTMKYPASVQRKFPSQVMKNYQMPLEALPGLDGTQHSFTCVLVFL